MDKQYKLTDRVSKDSIKSPIFKKWVKRILCIVCIISLALQLTLCCMPIQASAAEHDSVVGTWVFNSSISSTSNTTFNISFGIGSGDNIPSYNRFTQMKIASNSNWNEKALWYGSNTCAYAWKSDRFDTVGWLYDSYRTITIFEETTDETFISWLKANATKVVDEVYDFTGETRIFNDELTLFNTSDATFTNSFNFRFDVLGVGTADYLILQRTTQNKYTMSYSFDFEDSGGLTMIYRDSPPFDNGDVEWLGGKVNRKVITFISNPEDPEFQQWLLDNTTLFDNVKDAYQLGQQSGYNNGYEEGFANSLIGDSLSGPINALSQITLIEIQGTSITLGGVVMTAIALCLVLAFLKLYAGG